MALSVAGTQAYVGLSVSWGRASPRPGPSKGGWRGGEGRAELLSTGEGPDRNLGTRGDWAAEPRLDQAQPTPAHPFLAG